MFFYIWFNLCFLCTLCISFGLDEIYFTKNPQNVDVVQGKAVTLSCEVTPNEGVRYYWELNGSRIRNTTRRHQRGANLHITRVDRERDSGQFTCMAEQSSGISITSSSATLNIQWIEEPSVLLQEPESASFIQSGSDVTLRCHLEASGDVHYEWFRNGERLQKTPKLEIKKKRLHIKNVRPLDNGVYRCGAKNEAGIKYSYKTFILAVPGDHSPLIQTPPRDQIIKKNTSAFINCVYQAADVVEWYFKNKGPLKNEEKITIYSNNTIEIKNFDSSDEGVYNCVGIKSESTEVPQSYTAELKLAYLHQLNSASFEPPIPDGGRIIVAEDSLFQLTCLEPKSLPSAKKWWTNSQGHTVSDTGEVKVDDDGRLIIENIKQIHSGNYTCVAENIAGTTKKSISVIVTTRPVIKLHPESMTVKEGEPTILSCIYDSSIQSQNLTFFQWRKDGKVLNNENLNRHQRMKVYKENGTLYIQSTVPSDRGEYACEIVTNQFEPVLSKPATLSVIEILKFTPSPMDRNLELGSTAKIHCKAQGTPNPVVHWEKKGLGADNFPSHITDTNGTLHFNGVLADDKGRYTCIGINAQGVINASINIDVVVAPKFSVPPKNPIEAIEGQNIIIDCVVEGDPKPMIHWDKNLIMNDFDKSRFTVLENGSLVILDVRKDDENKYGCTAGSSAGLNRKETQLIVSSYEDATVTKAVIITMSVAAAYIILVVGLMVWCRYRRKSRKLPMTDAKAENGDVEHTELKEEIQNGNANKDHKNDVKYKDGQKSDGTETSHSHSSSQSKKSKQSYDKIAISKNILKDMKFIGRGEFGDVFLAKSSKSLITKTAENQELESNGISEDKEIFLLVKALTQTKDETCLAEFKREIDLFLKLSHENVSKLIGLCRESEPHYMVFEHTDWGDLKQFLVATQKNATPPLTNTQCVAVIHQIAKGMEHISSNRLIHKDLAARNCLVTSSLSVKVALPRLTRDPYSQEYCKHMNHIIPLRWLPHEAVYEDEYSVKSDVYAFGVVILEIFSQGELPFPKINDNTFLNKLKEKKLEWKAHPSTPDELAKIQELCWDIDLQKRPLFTDITKNIAELLKSM